MAHPVTIVGTITDSSGISKQVTITGIGSVQVDPGYGVGTPVPPHPAHPIVLPTPPVDPGYGVPLPPLGIWGGAPPAHIAHPIAPGGLPPVDPGYGVPLPPLGIWGGAPPAHIAHPIAPGGPPPVATPPIYYPPEIWPNPPEVPDVPPVMPPGSIIPPGWSWYYTQYWGWVLVWRPPAGGGKPQPIPTPPVATPKQRE